MTNDTLHERMSSALTLSWAVFCAKVGNGYIIINKEASMQLQYAYILQQLLPLITVHPEETFTVELETGVKLNDKNREIDLVFVGELGPDTHRIAVEMKCYKKRASSGGMRGAQDIFKKDVYEDLRLLQEYMKADCADQCFAMVMTDYEGLVNPKSKESKSWTYDTSDKTTVKPGVYAENIGGKEVSIMLENTYRLEWTHQGELWFLLTAPE